MPKPSPYSVGTILGDKEIIAFDGKNKHGQYVWTVRCINCGEAQPGRSSSSLKRMTPCRKCSTLGDKAWNWSGYEAMYGKWLYTTEQAARRRGYSWEITHEDMWSQWLIQEGKCAYTGWDLFHGPPGVRTASLDRIDNTQGYTVENIQWVHKEVNAMKHVYSEDFFLAVVEAIAKNRGLS